MLESKSSNQHNKDSNNGKNEIISHVRKIAFQYTIGIIGSVAVFAFIGWWTLIKPYIIAEVGGVPSGAIIPFDRPNYDNQCPEGWSPWSEGAGRVVIGAGQGQGLTRREYRQLGGEEAHVLSLNEMPRHSHGTVQMIGNNDIDGVDSTTLRSGDHHNENRETAISGNSEPHNNMPPFIALYYCRRN